MAGFWGEVRISPEIVLHLPWEFVYLPWKVMHLPGRFNDRSKWKFYIFWLLKPRLHEQIVFDKFNMTNAFDQLAC
jgi:hypothetical protein